MSELPCDNSNPPESSKSGNKKKRGSSKGEKAQKIDDIASVESNGDGATGLISASQIKDIQLMHDTEHSVKDTQKTEPCTSKELMGNSSPKMTGTGSDNLLKSQKSKDTDESSKPKMLEMKGSSSTEPMRLSTQFTSDEKSKNTQDSNAGILECGSHQSVSQEMSKHKKKGANSSSNAKLSETKLLKRLEINKYTNFMKDFDPERSQREARKLENLPFTEKKEKKKQRNDKRLYDENGIFIETGEDLCDCLITDCPGCHFPCYKCRSCKCGHACRRNRTWCYDEIEIEGTGEIIRRKK